MSAPDCQVTTCHYRSLVEKTREILIVIDQGGQVIFVNQAISHYGGQPEQFIGKKFSELLASEDSWQAKLAFQRTLEGQPEIFDIHLQVNPQTAINFRASSEAIYENQALIGVAIILLEYKPAQNFEKILEKHASQLILINEIGEKISSLLEIDQILSCAATLLQKSFGYYHVAIFTPDSQTGDLVMTARAGSFASLFPSGHRLKRGQGMIGWVRENRHTLLAKNVRHETAYVNLFPDRIPCQSELSVPILAGNDVAGVIDIQSPLLNAFDEDDLRVIETIASQLSVAMVNARLYAEVRLRLREREHAEAVLRLQRDLLSTLSTARDYQTTLQELVHTLGPLGGIDSGSLYMVNDQGGLSGVAHIGLSPDFIRAVNYLPPEAHKTRFVMAGQIGYLRYADLNLDQRIPGNIRLAEGLRSLAVLPLQHQGRVIASLTFGCHTRDEIPAEIRGVLESVASYLASTLARVQAELDLSLSEARNRALLQALPDLLFVVDQNGCFTNFKYDTESLLYVPPEKIVGRYLEDILPLRVAQQARETLRKALESRQVQQFEYELTFADQRERIFEARMSAASETSVITVVREITQQRDAERQRQRLLDMETGLNKISADSLTASSLEALIQSLLKETSQVLGVTRSALVFLDETNEEGTINAEWTRPGISIPAHSNHRVSIRPYLKLIQQLHQNHPILITGHEEDPEVHRLKEQGVCAVLAMPLFVQTKLYGILVCEQNLQAKTWVSEETSFVRSAAQLVGQAIERFISQKELTQRVQDLESINQSLAHADRQKNQILAGMGHDLQSAIQSLPGSSQAAGAGEAGPLTLQQREHLEAIRHESQRLLDYLNHLDE